MSYQETLMEHLRRFQTYSATQNTSGQQKMMFQLVEDITTAPNDFFALLTSLQNEEVKTLLISLHPEKDFLKEIIQSIHEFSKNPSAQQRYITLIINHLFPDKMHLLLYYKHIHPSLYKAFLNQLAQKVNKEIQIIYGTTYRSWSFFDKLKFFINEKRLRLYVSSGTLDHQLFSCIFKNG